MINIIRAYISLTKPTIVLLFAITGLSAIIIERSLLDRPLDLFLILVGITLTAGSANALNMYFDREIDALMNRTRTRRPLPLKKISPESAGIFGIVLGIIATSYFYFMVNPLTAFLGFFTIFFYVVIYTLILKRNTDYNIVIGGVAGSTAPLMGWAAAANEISLVAWILFAIIFLWTPPHFWALAITIKDEYQKANIPMLPVTKGDQRTKKEILIYTIVLIPVTFLPVLFGDLGYFYLITASLLGLVYLKKTFSVMDTTDNRKIRGLFLFSILYLLALFFFMIVDRMI